MCVWGVRVCVCVWVLERVCVPVRVCGERGRVCASASACTCVWGACVRVSVCVCVCVCGWKWGCVGCAGACVGGRGSVPKRSKDLREDLRKICSQKIERSVKVEKRSKDLLKKDL